MNVCLVVFILEKNVVEGFDVFKSVKKQVPVENEEDKEEEDGPSEAKKELNRQMEVCYLFVFFYNQEICTVLQFSH